MIEYKISYQNPNSHILNIEMIIPDVPDEAFTINLPSWRPGRYERANYAKNVYKVEAFSSSGTILPCIKTAIDSWAISSDNIGTVVVKYKYYAFQMDAGNSWLDDEQLYLNPINCLMYIKERMNEKCSLKIDVPPSYKIACGLRETARSEFLAENYFELADSPLFASASLKCLKYTVEDTAFFIWIQGSANLNQEKLLTDFRVFSEYQIKMMGVFPEKDFHFLFQFLPHAFRHGVEHRNSTVITIGPGNQVGTALYKDVLGISSHELFHCWNVLKIRPKEMLPYDFSRENYFRTGYVAEGFTTYYGDLILARTGGFTIEDYLEELNDLLKRHFDNGGNLNLSLADSSFDLWLDGYVPGIPNRKVSIYIKGAIVAFLLDVHIRKSSDNRYSLDELMVILWKEYGAKGIGYDESTIIELTKEHFNVDVKRLVDDAVYGCSFLEEELVEAFYYLGLEIKKTPSPVFLETDFGIKCLFQNNKWMIDQIKNDSQAYKSFSRNDEIISINDRPFDPLSVVDGDEIAIEVSRGGRAIVKKLQKENKNWYFTPQLSFVENPSKTQVENFKKWLNIKV